MLADTLVLAVGGGTLFPLYRLYILGNYLYRNYNPSHAPTFCMHVNPIVVARPGLSKLSL